MKKKIFITLLFISLPAMLFAGTLFEDEKKTSDPFVSDRGGFNSIFVNPAGMAGQSGFELAVNMGMATTSNDIKLIMGVTEMATAMMDTGLNVESVSDATQTLSDLYSSGVITDDLLDAIFEGTTLDPDSFTDWDDPAAIQAEIDSGSVDTGIVETNLDEALNNPASAQYADFNAGLPGEVSVDVVASLKTGLLIKGFGLGIYDQAAAVAFMEPGTTEYEYGFKTIYNELGAVAGFGFNLFQGKLALGMSGNYGILMKNTSTVDFDSFGDIINGSVKYGYNWGVDVGAIWRPTPSLGVGLVFNDVVGYTQADTPYTAAGINGFIDDGAYLMSSLDYKVTVDMDAGISWQPDWRFVTPRIGLDLYNVIGYARDVSDNGDTFQQAMYRSLEHIRVGAQFTFFDFMKVGAQWYDHYLNVGAGLDLLFLELYGEVKVHESAISKMVENQYGDIPFAADLSVRIHF